ncbi:hypothetical protein ACIOHR_37625 [Streptomyces anulatus]
MPALLRLGSTSQAMPSSAPRSSQNHNLAPGPEDELNYDDTSVRQIEFETYAAAVDWTDYAQVSRALLVFEDFIRYHRQSGWESNWLEEVTVKLELDGLSVDERGRISWLRRSAAPSQTTQPPRSEAPSS